MDKDQNMCWPNFHIIAIVPSFKALIGKLVKLLGKKKKKTVLERCKKHLKRKKEKRKKRYKHCLEIVIFYG